MTWINTKKTTKRINKTYKHEILVRVLVTLNLLFNKEMLLDI